MAGLNDVDKALFPLKSIPAVIQLFQNQLESSVEPDLALLSIIVGAIEDSLTCCRNYTPEEEEAVFEDPKLPVLDLETIQSLYDRFHYIIKSSVDLSQFQTKFATRELIKRVSDVIWNSLSRNYYKDRAHLQSLYNYLTCHKLDCYGAAFAVVAGCQVLGFNDVHLALSEDHSWVVYGENEETVEVTWHGKGNEDKRGLPVDSGVASKSWVYVDGEAVVCDRAMEIATVVSAINPSLCATTDAPEVALLQQELLWLLYDLGHLTKYPMALGNLGELEESAPTHGRPAAIEIFQEAVQSARKYYGNAHIYPYTYLGGYLYRNGYLANALASWADAADALRRYNYCRDDGEIYKELLEIANELIPHIVRVDESLLRQPRCFGYLLRFYDGICQWEEGANTPVLHIGWARPLVNIISKFDASIRAQIIIECIEDEPKTLADDKDKQEHGSTETLNNNNNNNDYCNTKEKGNAVKDLNNSDSKSTEPSLIQVLTAACSEKILNRDYLLQGEGVPFLSSPTEDLTKDCSSTPSTSNGIFESEIDLDFEYESPRITLFSQKMKGLKDLLLNEKLNTHAISLQLTAQSQVQVGKKTRGNDESGIGHRLKRSRRD